MTIPFSQDHVLRVTLERIEKCISFSTQKVIGRMEEFKDDKEKTEEIGRTLMSLSKLNQMIENVRNENSNIIENIRM